MLTITLVVVKTIPPLTHKIQMQSDIKALIVPIALG